MLQVTRPMGLGELLDGAFRLYRAFFSHLVLIAALFLVPVGVLNSVLLGFTVGDFNELVFASGGSSAASGAPFLRWAGSYFVLGLIGYVAMAMVYVSLISYITALLQGESLTVGDSVRRGLRRLFPFIGVVLLAAVALAGLTLGLYIVLALAMATVLIGVGLLGSAGGEGMGVAAVGAMITLAGFYLLASIMVLAPAGLLTARWIGAPTAVVAETLGPRRALTRSWALTRGNLWRSFGYLVLLLVLNFVVLGLPLSALQWLLTFALTSQWFGLLSGLLTGLGYLLGILWYPLVVLALTLFYFDLRVRNESLDLDQRIRALEQSMQPASLPG